MQRGIVSLIPGLERASILQWGYAIEYDFVPPEQIDVTLMSKRVRGLFLAGQVCGTSGYEEAGGQGLLAGVNAVHLIREEEPVILGRDQAYIGVMIDDLVTRGVTEPYRMFTSRAEHRLHLRYDNADARLTPLGREIGLVDDARWERFQDKSIRLQQLRSLLDGLRHEGMPLRQWLKRPEENGQRFAGMFEELARFHNEADVWARALVEVKYDGYIHRQQRAIEQFRALENQLIPADFNYRTVSHLRFEAQERLAEVRPRSIGQAARVSGIHPTDITVLMVELARSGTAAQHPREGEGPRKFTLPTQPI